VCWERLLLPYFSQSGIKIKIKIMSPLPFLLIGLKILDFRIFGFLTPGIFSFLLVLFPFFLLKRKKWAWVASVILLLIILILLLHDFITHDIKRLKFVQEQYHISKSFSLFLFLLPMVYYLIPLILLLLDHKNFWKVAT
jgi:hypothetical protein